MKRQDSFWKIDPKNDWVDRLVCWLAVVMGVFLVSAIFVHIVSPTTIKEFTPNQLSPVDFQTILNNKGANV